MAAGVAVIVDNEFVDPRASAVLRLLHRSPEYELLWVGAAPSGDAFARDKVHIPLVLRWLMNADRWLRVAEHSMWGYENLSAICPELKLLSSYETQCALQGRSAGEQAATPYRKPDLIVALSAQIMACDLASHTDVETWWFEAEGGYTYTPFEGFSDVTGGRGVSRIMLRRCLPGHGPMTLGIAEARTHPGSPHLNGMRLRDVGVRVFADALSRRRSVSGHEVSARGDDTDASEARGALERQFRARHALPLIGRALATAVRSRFAGHTDEVQWSIGIGDSGDVDWEHGHLGRIRWLQPRQDEFFADPFLIERDDRTWLFMEEFKYKRRRGMISVIDASALDANSRPTPVLERPFHLSFPSLIETAGEIYMLPEQVESNELVLYKSHAFPFDWRPEATLLRGMAAADPVLLEHDGLWWLFFSAAELRSHDNNLQLYFAERIEGPYHRHPASPVRESLFGTRMAGRIFRDGDRLIRPAQDCRTEYGAGLVFYEIRDLSPTSFREVELSRITANQRLPFGLGIHSFSRANGLFAIDGFRYREGRQHRRWRPFRAPVDAGI